ncbi:MAG: GNAT family N-acetyltransferase [Candidatus Heimdallarchaeota archaeon]
MINRKTERLILRNFIFEDWEDLLEIAQQYEKTEFANYDHQWPQTPLGIKEIVELFRTSDAFAAVELKSNNKVIGLIQIQKKESSSPEIIHGFGYVFNSDYHGKGYASESCRDILEYLFVKLKIDKTVAGTPITNKSSCKLLERLGFKEISRETKHFRKDAEGNPIEFLAGKFELKVDDWKNQNNRLD